MLAVKDIYWAAGLMEGEGYFGLRRGRDVVVQLSMTDKDVVKRIAEIFRVGTSAKERPLPSGKTCYTWIVTKQADAAGLMMTLLPLMGIRRAAKIRECLAGWRSKGPSKGAWTHCSHGHPLSGANLRIQVEKGYEKRRCVQCEKLRMRKHRALRLSDGTPNLL